MNIFSLFKKVAGLAVFLMGGCVIFFIGDDDDRNNSSFHCSGCTIYSSPVTYEGEIYETVIIGTQVWLNRNLNYDPGTDGSWCYENLPDACSKYGRLYDWATAMGLDSSCNSSYCFNQISTPHRGICPPEYHIPTNADWDRLLSYVDGLKYEPGLYYSPTAGKCLRTVKGWSDGNGVDTYGFSLLPSTGRGMSGHWWSANEFSNVGANYRNTYFLYPEIRWDGGDKYKGYSVRCLRDLSDDDKSFSCAASSSSSGGVVYGAPVTYEGEIYETVIIGTQTWFKRNLNYDPGTGLSWCYDNDPANCAKYGRLYNWRTAMALPSTCSNTSCESQITVPHRGICPEGYHIPTNDDWDKLLYYLDDIIDTGLYKSSTAGLYLKATSGWYYNGIIGNGKDTYGFSALPGGRHQDGYFDYIGYSGHWWSANEEYSRSYIAYDRGMNYGDGAGWGYREKSEGISVRCIKDSEAL